MDLESVCRPEAVGKHLRGRVDFILSAQISKKTFAEANAVVGAVLEPINLARVLEHCGPINGKPPMVLRIGVPIGEVLSLLGPSLEELEETGRKIFNYGTVRVQVRDGKVTSIVIPAID